MTHDAAPTSSPPGADATDADDAALLAGPARLAYFMPIPTPPVSADRKASALIAANALILSVVTFFAASLRQILHGDLPPAVVMGACLATLLVLLLLGGWWAFGAMITPLPPMPATLAFYPNIAAKSYAQYAAAMRGLTHRAAVRAALHYNYSLARQSVRKFALVRRSMICFRAATLLWMVVLVVTALKR